ncbi:MAG: hypothetical protein M3134_08930 [Actinomycetota bacterium]|nr:hypothetical protein [Actinomycetota bacterium]
MRRTFAAGLVVMTAMSIWIAPGASASGIGDCDPGTPPENTIVTIGGGQIKISPGSAPGYATAVAGWARAYVDCLVAEVVNDPLVECVNSYVANRPTVTVDPETLDVIIDYSAFINTACEG